MLLMILLYLRCHVAKEALVSRRDRFGVIVKLLPYLELLMYAKPILLLVGSNNVYGTIF